jgi:inorganic phosphate transporter, PiT family
LEVGVLIFLSSGLFLGWALGANDAANVFGTAVGTRMVNFTTAAIICSIFVILGAVISGAGAAHTLGKLGAVNALPGAFMAAFAAALAVYLMTKAGLPVSTSQAIVGAIIGWNLFTNTVTDAATLTKIMSTWVLCPILAAIFSAIIFKCTVKGVRWAKMHLLRVDAYTRLGLILAGAFGSYSLGANNIANVMGVFVSSSPFNDISVGGFFTMTSAQQLFLIGAIAIGVGVITYSKRVMLTVGTELLPLSPIAAWVAVVSHSIVLFLFASQGLKHLLESNGLPSIPLVPVSSSQAVVGAVLGIALVQGGKNFQWRVFGSISLGWVVTPLIACAICFVGLFFLQNVFSQKVYQPVAYTISNEVAERLEKDGLDVAPLRAMNENQFDHAVALDDVLNDIKQYGPSERKKIMVFAKQEPILIASTKFTVLNRGPLSPERLKIIQMIDGQFYPYEWMLRDDLALRSVDWQKSKDDKYNRDLDRDFEFVMRLFKAK